MNPTTPEQPIVPAKAKRVYVKRPKVLAVVEEKVAGEEIVYTPQTPTAPIDIPKTKRPPSAFCVYYKQHASEFAHVAGRERMKQVATAYRTEKLAKTVE